MNNKDKKLAKCIGFEFAIEDHGCPALYGHFEYEEGGCQGLGYSVDAAFLMRFMDVFGVEKLSQVNGKSCWVVADFDKIHEIHPLHKKEGTPFVIKEWASWLGSLPYVPSPYEMRTGKKP